MPHVIRRACIARIVTITEARRRAGTHGAFPLGLGWKTIPASRRNVPRREFSLRQFPAVIRRVGPGYTRDRTAQIAGELAGICVHDREVFALRHFEFSNPE